MTVAEKMGASKACEIYSVLRKNALLWKWRYTGADGRTTDSADEYRLFLQCAAAARALGLEPRSDWTGPCALIMARRAQPTEVLPE
jgi:hypothetical protein